MRGYGIVLSGEVLCHDHEIDRPFFVTTKRAAKAAFKALPPWLSHGARVVRLEIDGNTYIVGEPC